MRSSFILLASVCLLVACQPAQSPPTQSTVASAGAASAPIDPPADGWRESKTNDEVMLAWRSAGQDVALSCARGNPAMMVKAAITAPGPPPPGLEGTIAFSGKDFIGNANPAEDAAGGFTLEVALSAALLKAMGDSTSFRVTIGAAKIQSGIDTSATLLRFAKGCAGLQSTSSAGQ